MTHWMAKREYFDDKKVALFFRGFGCISVDRIFISFVAEKSKPLEVFIIP